MFYIIALSTLVRLQAAVSKRGPEMTYVTSRIIMCPWPDIPDTLFSAFEDSVKVALDQKHPDSHAVYNLSARQLKHDYGKRLFCTHLCLMILCYRLSNVPLPASGRTVPLHTLFALCENMSGYLRAQPQHVVVICGQEAHCEEVAAALTIYARLVPTEF